MNKLKHHTAYLVGPIECAEDGGVAWRKDMANFLRELEIGVLCPVDKATDTPEDEKFQQLCKDLKDAEKYDEYHSLIKQIVAADYRMVDKSDFLILYLDKNVHICGSYHETAMAAIQRKPIIVCCPQGKNAIPGWLFGIAKHQMFFDNWDDVKKYIVHVAMDDNVQTYNRWRFFDKRKVLNLE